MPKPKVKVNGNRGGNHTRDGLLKRQADFLKAYREVGTITHASKIANIDRNTVTKWDKLDYEGFRERFAEAKEEFADSLEQMAFQRIQQQKPTDNPVLLITLLNAHKPDKYRPKAVDVDETARFILLELRNKLKTIVGEATPVIEQLPKESGAEFPEAVKAQAETVLKEKRNDS